MPQDTIYGELAAAIEATCQSEPTADPSHEVTLSMVLLRRLGVAMREADKLHRFVRLAWSVLGDLAHQGRLGTTLLKLHGQADDILQ